LREYFLYQRIYITNILYTTQNTTHIEHVRRTNLIQCIVLRSPTEETAIKQKRNRNVPMRIDQTEPDKLKVVARTLIVRHRELIGFFLMNQRLYQNVNKEPHTHAHTRTRTRNTTPCKCS
jgi:hypothetical protein